jgi:hypothetical protein
MYCSHWPGSHGGRAEAYAREGPPCDIRTAADRGSLTVLVGTSSQGGQERWMLSNGTQAASSDRYSNGSTSRLLTMTGLRP